MTTQKLFLFFVSFYVVIHSFAQNYSEFQDPNVFEINKIYPRTNHIIPSDSKNQLTWNLKDLSFKTSDTLFILHFYLNGLNPKGELMFEAIQTFTITNNHDLFIANHIKPSLQVKTVGKVGLQLCISKDYKTASWLGFGNETYPDRMKSGLIGWYDSPISELFYKYVRPQESGNRTSTKQLILYSRKNRLNIDFIDSDFNFSIYPYTDQNMAL